MRRSRPWRRAPASGSALTPPRVRSRVVYLAPFPALLVELAYPELAALLDRIDPTPDSLTGSGAADWSVLEDTMYFIADLFRCYHAWEPLFDSPFTPAQVAHLQAGRRPEGRL
jgi:hypothetical protein